jgi:hypothetical protein
LQKLGVAALTFPNKQISAYVVLSPLSQFDMKGNFEGSGMLRVLFALSAVFLGLAPAALAQSAITLQATPVPLVDAEINNRPVRLELDLRMPEALAMSNAAGERLRVRRVPFASVRIGVDGSEATIRGRIARPRLEFGGETSRAFSGLFPTQISRHGDGLIGPAALPQDVVTIILGPELPGARDMVFALEDPDSWAVNTTIGGETLVVWFNLSEQATVLNRSATRMFDASGAIVASGDLREAQLIMGISTLMQPVQSALTFEGIALAPLLARTNSPLLGADEADALVVVADAESSPPAISIGRAALSRCSSIRGDRRARTLTLRCAS